MSTQEIMTLVIPSVIAVISALSGVYALARTVKMQQAELAEKYQRIADKAIDDVYELREQVGRLEKNLRDRDTYIEYLLRNIARLVEQVQARGDTPVWTPEARKPFD